MKAYGWIERKAWGREGELAAGGVELLIDQVGPRQSGCHAKRELTAPVPLKQWQQLGVRTAAGAVSPRLPSHKHHQLRA